MLFLHFLVQNFEQFLSAAVIINISKEKQMNWPYKQHYAKTSRCFYRKV